VHQYFLRNSKCKCEVEGEGLSVMEGGLIIREGGIEDEEE
jgi:hypothetical protein